MIPRWVSLWLAGMGFARLGDSRDPLGAPGRSRGALWGAFWSPGGSFWGGFRPSAEPTGSILGTFSESFLPRSALRASRRSYLSATLFREASMLSSYV